MRKSVLTILLATILFFALSASAHSKVSWHRTGATVYSAGCNGAYGNVCGVSAFAELGMGTAMGGLKPGTKVRFLLPNGRKVDGRKLDIGLGGPPIGGLPRGADLRCELLRRGGINNCVSWSAVVRWRIIPKRRAKAALVNGAVPPPYQAPRAVRRFIAGANKIAKLPYLWGGGHASFRALGYDCSGSVSYALHAAKLLKRPLVSGALASYGRPGPGKWITLYANGGHVFARVAGLYFDTSGASPSRWQRGPKLTSAYTVRHPQGL